MMSLMVSRRRFHSERQSTIKCALVSSSLSSASSIFANNASLAGHVHVDHDVILGGFSGVHQFCQIGAHSMASMGSMIVKDVPAFVMVSGDTAKPHGMNVEGMRRRHYSKEMITTLRNAYKLVYRQGQTAQQAIAELESWPAFDQLTWFIDSIKNSKRGITR